MDKPQSSPPSPPLAARRPTVVALRGTAHLLATVPHLLGYQPGRSVVIIASCLGPAAEVDVDAPGRLRATVRVTVRFDLPEVDDVAPVLEALAEPLRQAAAGPRPGDDGQLVLHAFVYEADDDVAAAVSTGVAGLADEHGYGLNDLVLVRDGHYLPLVAEGVSLGHQQAWVPVPPPADVPGVADLVLSGRYAAGSRDDVGARVRRRDEEAAAATTLALTLLDLAPETYDPLDALHRLGRWVVRGEDEPTPRDRARIAVALGDRTLRDAVMARWLPRLFTVEEVLPEDMAHDVRRAVPPWSPHGDLPALDRLLGLAARMPAAESVPLLTLAGAVAWRMGEGTIANEAVGGALDLDPAYRMALLLRAALDRGLPPWTTRSRVA